MRQTGYICHSPETLLLTVVLCGIGANSNKCKLECRPVPNVMAALLNVGGAIC